MNEEKQYSLHTDITGNCFIVGNCCKFGMFDKLERSQVIRVIDELNEQDEEIQQLKKEILELRAENKKVRFKGDGDDIRRRCEVKEAFKEVFGDME